MYSDFNPCPALITFKCHYCEMPPPMGRLLRTQLTSLPVSEITADTSYPTRPCRYSGTRCIVGNTVRPPRPATTCHNLCEFCTVVFVYLRYSAMMLWLNVYAHRTLKSIDIELLMKCAAVAIIPACAAICG